MAIIPTRSSADVNASADINELSTKALAISDLDDTPADDAETAVTSKWIYDNIGTTAIKLAVRPVGTVYWQPADDSGSFGTGTEFEPGTLFGGTWTRLWNGGDGEFPKAEGGSGGQTRTSGLQPDQTQGHKHGTNGSVYDRPGGSATHYASGSTLADNFRLEITTPTTDGVNGTPRTGTVTEPTNREFKLWKRTA